MLLISVPMAIGKGMWRAIVGILTAALHIPNLIGWILVSIVSIFVATPTTVRYIYSKEMSVTQNLAQAIGFAALYITVLCSVLDIVSKPPHPCIVALSTYIPYFGYVLLGALGTNILSFFYELGRKKTEDTAKFTEDGADSEEKKDDGTSDFMTMFDSIRSFESISPVQASELYRRIIELLGAQKITPDESKKLHEIVQNGVRAHIG